MSKRVLITGVQGFTGRYLAAELSAAGYEVHGLAHNAVTSRIAGVHALHVSDLADAANLQHVVDLVQPDWVAHLAAIAFVGHGDVDAIYRTNLIGSRNLLEALVRCPSPVSAVLLASSANVYGNASGGTLDERAVLNPANDYAASKIAMEYMAKVYTARLPLIVARPFNYTGRGQSENFLLPKIVNHVRRREKVLELGNLHVARDFSDIRVIVQHYRGLLESPSALGETFNICSGRAYTLSEVLEMVRSLAQHHFEVKVNPAFVRNNEVKILLGDHSKLKSVVPFINEIALHETLSWMLEEPLQT